MNFNDAIIRREEGLVLGLRRLYESFGYKKFKMRKFEKYDLYRENKSFLHNTNIITVTDPAGRLLALKPDITLSIVKNVGTAPLPEKLYYNENIYFADSNAGEIKETTQVGLEYIGELDIRALGEILLLAAESLAQADENYRIAISHMGIISEILDSVTDSESVKERIYELISDKNLHGIQEICSSLLLHEEETQRLSGLITVSGPLCSTIKCAEKLVCGDSSKASIQELKALSEIIDSFDLTDKFILDFSVMNDISYYNGLVFQGFINGVPKTVLSGGRYDNLVRRFGCNTSAAGFAVSVELLQDFNYRRRDFDYDIFLLYSPDCNPSDVIAAQKDFAENGERCIALSAEKANIKYAKKVVMSSDGSLKYE